MADTPSITMAPTRAPKFNLSALMRSAHWNARWIWKGGTAAGRKPYRELFIAALAAEWAKIKNLRATALRAREAAAARAAAGLPPVERKPALRTRHSGWLAGSFAN